MPDKPSYEVIWDAEGDVIWNDWRYSLQPCYITESELEKVKTEIRKGIKCYKFGDVIEITQYIKIELNTLKYSMKNINELIEKHLEKPFHPSSLSSASVKYFAESGKISGGFYQAIKSMLLEQSKQSDYYIKELQNLIKKIDDWSYTCLKDTYPKSEVDNILTSLVSETNGVVTFKQQEETNEAVDNIGKFAIGFALYIGNNYTLLRQNVWIRQGDEGLNNPLLHTNIGILEEYKTTLRNI